MAVESTLQAITVQASADLSSNQYMFVLVNSSGQLAAASVDSAIAGVLQDKPAAAGRAGNLAYSGRSKIKLGGTVTAGNFLTSDSSGNAVAVASGSAVSAGIALTSGTSGQIVDMLIQLAGAQFSALPN